MKFRNIDEIRKYYQKLLGSGNQEITKSLQGNNSIVTDEVLIASAKELQECIQKRIEEYYASYTPEFYKRTDGLKNALHAQTYVSFVGGKRCIGLYFDDSKSWGKSVVDGKWSGYKPWLINDGFKDKSYDTAHFLGYKGFGFIEKGIEDWKSKTKYKNIEVMRTGQKGNFDLASNIGYTYE